METCDTYCLVPPSADLAALVDALFHFDCVVFHDGKRDHPICSGADVALTFRSRMGDHDHIRFHVARLPDTVGGWLYRLADGAAVVGLSGDASKRGVTRSRLDAMVPGGRAFDWGDQPPPESSWECMQAWRSHQ
jgi:hypothetical protein